MMAEPSPATNDVPDTRAEASNTTTAESSETQTESTASASHQVAAAACGQCGKSADSLKQCIKCHSVAYCNKDCQKAHFKAHKKACPILAQEYVKRHEPKMASRSSGAAKGGARERGLQKWQARKGCGALVQTISGLQLHACDASDRGASWCSVTARRLGRLQTSQSTFAMTDPNPRSQVFDQLHADTTTLLPSQLPYQPHEPLPNSIPPTPDEAAQAGPCSDTVVPDTFSSFLDASLPQPFPLPSALPQPLTTPITEDRPHVDLTLNLPQSSLSLPPPTIIKAKHNLRLPSFHVLGIAAPHPDHILTQPDLPFSPLGAGPLSKPEDPLHALSPLAHSCNNHATAALLHTPVTSPKAATARVGPSLSTHTPPSDSEPGTINWGSFMNPRIATLGSPPHSDPGVSPSANITARELAPPQAQIIVPTHAPLSEVQGMATWIEMAKSTIIHESGCLGLDSVRILSHALPCPSTAGHVFGDVIASIHDASSTHTSWINVFHALPGRYTLLDLPKSPPSTPGPAVGGDSYFTSKVFDSAVAIPDYQLDSKLLPPSPRPVVPPGSINISIVERYIPPTNTNEFAEMFTFHGRSLLYDRLIELSSDNGILLFIYPTKTGAKTFMRQYLGPILDPLLRSVTVVHELHSELGRDIGQMSSVNYLDVYEHLEVQVRRFCHAMSERHLRADKKAAYQVIHATKEDVLLERSAWADDWWIKQEKPRVRDVVMKYFNKSKKLPMGEMSAASLIQHVLDGVSKREYQDGAPTKGVEVGVFIIKKTKATTTADQ
ncbi:hypothetical protein COCMIDRAFT_38076 [Bipolaris oryzae ATCC 44560]|uniref:MYND-type domain-containing protein n=1 Tax=Bipolaris oryzae ATCC 44560 TaxID=930090 RepID=W6Z212_COCMI|nr:uncharacterized protein COCMIDRAFT_38076 [Bipolaris oryzae ATCC 44560]EUC44030.1 hypothetical protein COCMIDRAFT_38076 [Bipolaris oryzae ATCC 44560]